MMLLRPATMDDAQALFAWRNDPATRANSLNTEPVKWWDHLGWLRKTLTVPLETLTTLAIPARRLLIAETADGPVGTIRLDRQTDGSMEVSWTIAPPHRGQGLGTLMVRTAIARETAPLVAHIKPHNTASIRIAEQAGFTRAESSPDPALLTFRASPPHNQGALHAKLAARTDPLRPRHDRAGPPASP